MVGDMVCYTLMCPLFLKSIHCTKERWGPAVQFLSISVDGRQMGDREVVPTLQLKLKKHSLGNLPFEIFSDLYLYLNVLPGVGKYAKIMRTQAKNSSASNGKHAKMSAKLRSERVDVTHFGL